MRYGLVQPRGEWLKLIMDDYASGVIKTKVMICCCLPRFKLIMVYLPFWCNAVVFVMSAIYDKYIGWCKKALKLGLLDCHLG